jgi:hypothetical protein
MPTDMERLDWLEKHEGYGLISDDAGRWAVSTSGIQNLPTSDTPFDFVGKFWVEAADWRPSIREAIDAAMASEAELGK